ncbi:hypothetical protein [Deinococcus humi]|uniref:Uncharacterized protein n=1 Tax=Deinococcus humi TaxID=662880 RepID=A0A7W8JZ72_9DEIO|nr:hypothetical protein [Deinococcus humi]MBB5364638.1 hypothetical protein [Deinococcus humi]
MKTLSPQRWLVVRVWLEPDMGLGVWRASVRRDDQYLYFACPRALITYLSTAVQLQDRTT